MLNFLIGTYRLADFERRRLTAVVIVMLGHFLALIVAETLIQLVGHVYLNPFIAIVGVIWMLVAVGTILWVGGPLLAALWLTYFGTTGGNKVTALVHVLSRAIIGFFAIETFVNLMFTVIPFFTNWGGFALVLAGAACYFPLRHMARQTVDWSRWVWFPGLNIVLGLSLCVLTPVWNWAVAYVS